MTFANFLHSSNSLEVFPKFYGGILPSHTLAFYLALLGFSLVAVLLAIEFLTSLGNQQGKQSRLWYLAIAILAIGSFGSYSAFSDEVSINLRHSMNLHHCGRLSFDCSRQVDGTVEIIYYAFLSIFAQTPISTLRATYCLGLALFILTVFSPVLTGLFSVDSMRGRLSISLLALSPSLAATFGSGFGNGLVVMGFAFSFCYLLSGKIERGLTIASMLPLFRPDASIFSALLIVFGYLWHRRIYWLYLVSATVCAVSYFVLFYLLYGKLVPNPVLFKSAGESLLSNDRLLLAFYSFTGTHQFYLLYALATVSIVALLKQRRSGRTHIDWSKLLALTGLFLALVSLRSVYLAMQSGIPVFIFRYWAPLDVCLLIAFPLLIWRKPLVCKTLGRYLVFVIMIALPVTGLFTSRYRTDIDKTEDLRFMRLWGYPLYPDYKRLPLLLSTGVFFDKYLDNSWGFAVTEMATVSLPMKGKEVIDLWGYTNPNIANSPYCKSKRNVRVNPWFVVSTAPDVIWLRSTGIDSFLGFSPEQSELETTLIEDTTAGPDFLQVGPIEWQLDQYEPFWIEDNQKNIILFYIKKSLSQLMVKKLSDANFSLTSRRPLKAKQLISEFYSRIDLDMAKLCSSQQKIPGAKLLATQDDL